MCVCVSPGLLPFVWCAGGWLQRGGQEGGPTALRSKAPEHAMVDLLRKSFDLEPVKAGAKQWRMVDAGVGMGSSVGSGDWGWQGARMELWK